MSTLHDARDEILAVCEKHRVKLVVECEFCNEKAEIEVVYRGDEIIGSTRLYHD